jgi:hypothetical protein
VTTSPFPLPNGQDAAGAEAPAGDTELAQRAAASALHVAAMTAAMLEVAGRPDRLPTLLWPDVDPVVVQAIWDKAAAVATLAARRIHTARLDTGWLVRAHAELAEAGWHTMAAGIRPALPAGTGQRPQSGGDTAGEWAR